jgi:DNA-binding MarR family transcriptional regulator
MVLQSSTDLAADPSAFTRLDDPKIEAFGMLLETHNELSNATSKDLEAASGVPLPWFSVLIRLARTPGHRLRMSELARDMSISNSGLTRLIDRVEAAGHVRREACPSDRRGLHAVLTESGLQIALDAAPGHLDTLDATIGAALSPDELTLLTDLLRRVRNQVRDGDPAP